MRRYHAMFVHAHPDDESSKGAATMARYAKEGHRISVVTCTDGMAGDILNPAMDRPGVADRMAEIRADEMQRAIEILGITDHFWLGYPDSGYVEGFEGDGSLLADDAFYNVPLDHSTERLVALIRSTRPEVLVTYPPDGGYPHPDHIRTHQVSFAAYHAAADPEQYPGAGDPWTVSKLYYMGAFNRSKVLALHEAMLDRGLESPYTGWLERWDPDEEDPTTTSVEIGDYLDQRNQALLAHATQIDPDSGWFKVPDELIRQFYPYDDFELAHHRVPTTIPESSLFAGLDAGHADTEEGAAKTIR